MNRERIQQLAERIIGIRDRVDGVKEEEKEALAAAKDDGLHTAAFKSALKLKKLDIGQRADWLRAFDRYRDALGLDAQGELNVDTPQVKAVSVEKPASPPHDPSVGFGGAGDASGTYKLN